MSVNINAPILRIAKSVSVTIPTSHLSARQQKSLLGFVRTGICIGNGVPSIVASALRRSHNLGHICRAPNSPWTTWKNLKPHEMNELVAAATTHRLVHGADHCYSDYAINRRPTGSLYTQHLTVEIMNSIKLDSSPELADYCARMSAGEIKEITYDAYTSEDSEQ